MYIGIKGFLVSCKGGGVICFWRKMLSIGFCSGFNVRVWVFVCRRFRRLGVDGKDYKSWECFLLEWSF